MERAPLTTILLEARAGSSVAMDRLFRECGGRLLALIRLRMGSQLRERMESRDLLNGTLLRAFRKFESLEATSTPSLMAWLSRVAESEIQDQREQASAQRRDAAKEVAYDGADLELVAQLRSQTSRLILSEEQEQLERAMEELTVEHREILLLRKFEERSFQQIGERMGRSPDACRMLLARAMTALTLRMRGPE